MVGLGLDVLLAFPSDEERRRSGSWNCIHWAEKAGVRVVHPDQWG
jgi:hypothetical protein